MLCLAGRSLRPTAKYLPLKIQDWTGLDKKQLKPLVEEPGKSTYDFLACNYKFGIPEYLTTFWR